MGSPPRSARTPPAARCLGSVPCPAPWLQPCWGDGMGSGSFSQEWSSSKFPQPGSSSLAQKVPGRKRVWTCAGCISIPAAVPFSLPALVVAARHGAGWKVSIQSPRWVWAWGWGAVGRSWHPTAGAPLGLVGGQQPWLFGHRGVRSVPPPCCSPRWMDSVGWAGLAAGSAVPEPVSGCAEAAPGVQECGGRVGALCGRPWWLWDQPRQKPPQQSHVAVSTFGSSPWLLPAARSTVVFFFLLLWLPLVGLNAN